MVDLVLERAAQQPAGLANALALALQIGIIDRYPARAGHIAVAPWQAQAAFLPDLFFVAVLHNFGVDQHIVLRGC